MSEPQRQISLNFIDVPQIAHFEHPNGRRILATRADFMVIAQGEDENADKVRVLLGFGDDNPMGIFCEYGREALQVTVDELTKALNDIDQEGG